MLSIRSIEHEEKTITAGLREKFTRLAIEFAVEQNGCLDGVPVMHVVWRRLEIPYELPRVRIQRHDGTGVKIVAGPLLAREHRIGIARAPIEQVELGVIGAGHPRHAATVQHSVGVLGPRFRTRLAGVRLGVPAPLDGSRFRIQGFEESPNIRNVPGHSYDHVITDDQWRHR